MIVKTTGIVLRTIDFKESSLIATVFTRSHGKIALIAKGARKPKSKFSAFLTPGQILEIVFYHKASRSVQTLSDASYLHKLHLLRVDLEKMGLVVTCLELAGQLLHENEVNEEVFDFLEKLVQWINNQEAVTKRIFPYVQIRMAQLIGVGLQLPEKQIETDNGYISVESGMVTSTPDDGHAIRLTQKQFLFVLESLQSMKSSIFEIDLSKKELNDLIAYLDTYFNYHIAEMKPRRSDKIFDQLLTGNTYENP